VVVVVAIMVSVAAFAYLFQLVTALLGLAAVLPVPVDGSLQVLFCAMDAAFAFVVPV
jgi:hypothetical protein